MPKKLKFVFHVEDEEKNVIVEKSQTWLEFDDETLKEAIPLPSPKDYPQTVEGLTIWRKHADPQYQIYEIIQASTIVMYRFTRDKIVEWAQKQREGVN
jgi:hypothetical protein